MIGLTPTDLNTALLQYNISYANTNRLGEPNELQAFWREAYAKILDLQKVIQAKLPRLEKERNKNPDNFRVWEVVVTVNQFLRELEGRPSAVRKDGDELKVAAIIAEIRSAEEILQRIEAEEPVSIQTENNVPSLPKNGGATDSSRALARIPKEQTSSEQAEKKKETSKVELPDLEEPEHPGFFGRVSRIKSSTLNASVGAWPKDDAYKVIQKPELPAENITISENGILVDMPVNNEVFGEDISIPCPPGYDIDAIRFCTGEGGTCPVNLTSNSQRIYKVQRPQERPSLSKIEYTVKPSQELPEDSRTKLSETFNEKINLPVKDSQIKAAKKVAKKVLLISGKVAESLSFPEQLNSEQYRELCLILCNELRHAEIPSYISENFEFTPDPYGNDAIKSHPRNYSVVYFDERNQAHEIFPQVLNRSFHQAKRGNIAWGVGLAGFALSIPDTRHQLAEESKLQIPKPKDFVDDITFFKYFCSRIEAIQSSWTRVLERGDPAEIFTDFAILNQLHHREDFQSSSNESSFRYAEGVTSRYGKNRTVESKNYQSLKLNTAQRKAINELEQRDLNQSTKELKAALEASPELRAKFRNFILNLQRIDTKDPSVISRIFPNWLGSGTHGDLMPLIFCSEDLKTAPYSELARIPRMAILDSPTHMERNNMFKENFVEIAFQMAEALEARSQSIERDALIEEAMQLIEEFFTIDVHDINPYGFDYYEQDGSTVTSAEDPRKVYRKISLIARLKPKLLEDFLVNWAFDDTLFAKFNSKSSEYPTSLGELILEKNPAPSVFRTEGKKIQLTEPLLSRIVQRFKKGIENTENNNAVLTNNCLSNLKRMYNLGIDTSKIFENDDEINRATLQAQQEFFDRLHDEVNSRGPRTISTAWSDCFDLELHPKVDDNPMPPRWVGYEIPEADIYRRKLRDLSRSDDIPNSLRSNVGLARYIDNFRTITGDWNPGLVNENEPNQFKKPRLEAWHASEMLALLRATDAAPLANYFPEATYNQIQSVMKGTAVIADNEDRRSAANYCDCLDICFSEEEQVALFKEHAADTVRFLEEDLDIDISELTTAFHDVGGGEYKQIKKIFAIDSELREAIRADENLKTEIEHELQRRAQHYIKDRLKVNVNMMHYLCDDLEKADQDKWARFQEDLKADTNCERVMESFAEAFKDTDLETKLLDYLETVLLDDFNKRALRAHIIGDKLGNICHIYPDSRHKGRDLKSKPVAEVLKDAFPRISNESFLSHAIRHGRFMGIMNSSLDTAIIKNAKERFKEGSTYHTSAEIVADEIISTRNRTKPDLEPLQKSRAQRGVAGEMPGVIRAVRGMHADTRPYIPGDDLRNMNWRATARHSTAGNPRYFTNVATTDIDLRSREYIVDLAWLTTYYGEYSTKLGERIGINNSGLVQNIYRNLQEKRKVNLVLCSGGAPVIVLDQQALQYFTRPGIIKDKYGERSCLADFMISLELLAKISFNDMGWLGKKKPILKGAYKLKYQNPLMWLCTNDLGKIQATLAQCDSWSRQGGAQIDWLKAFYA